MTLYSKRHKVNTNYIVTRIRIISQIEKGNANSKKSNHYLIKISYTMAQLPTDEDTVDYSCDYCLLEIK